MGAINLWFLSKKVDKKKNRNRAEEERSEE